MDPEQFRRISEIFAEARKLEGAERAGYLDEACGGDSSLRAEVEQLLEAHESPPSALRTGAMISDGVVSAGATGEVGEAAAADPASTPDTIGPYRIVGLLGRGGMGTVYEAIQKSPHRSVALKVLSARFASDEMLRRFEHEAQLLGRLEHPDIARIYEAGTADTVDGPRSFFAMELIAGEPLTAFADARDLGLDERLDLIAKICDAVHHAHQKGIVHRDLKPANILVGTEGRPKILDFGIARVTEGDIEVTSLHTSEGQLIGTLPYMSPEQASGDPTAIDTRSDIYSLGVVAYELVAGRLPLDLGGRSLYEALELIRDVEPEPLGAVHRSLRGDVTTVVGKALEKDKERRYASAAELAADLRRYLRDEPILAHPPSAYYQLRKLARRHKALVGAAVAVLLALVVGLVATVRQMSKTEAQYVNAKAVGDFLQNMFESTDPRGAGPEARVADFLDAADRDLRPASGIEPSARAALLTSIGMGRYGIGQYERAETVLEEALEIHRSELGDDTREVADLHFKLGCVLMESNRYAAAREHLERARDLQTALLGPRDLAVARTLDRLGQLVMSLGERERGESMVQEALAIYRERLPGNHHLIAASLQRLATALSSGPREAIDRAERLFLEALAIARALGPEDSLDVARAREKLAAYYHNAGKFVEAEQLVDGVVAALEKHLGPDHPEVARALYDTAFVASWHGRSLEAADAARRALRIRRAASRPDDIFDSLAQLGHIALGMGDLETADESFREAIEIETELNGPQSLRIASVRSRRADILMRQGRHEDALLEKEWALDRYVTNGSGATPEAAKVHVDLAELKERLKDPRGAESHWRTGLEIFRRTPGWSYDAHNAETRLGLLLSRTGGNPEEIEALLRRGWSGFQEEPGERSPESASAAMSLGRFLYEQKKFEEAEPFLRQALTLHLELTPDGRRNIQGLRIGLGRCLYHLGKLQQAEELLLAAYENRTTDGLGRRSVEFLADLYEAMERPEKAREMRAELEVLPGAEVSEPSQPPAGTAFVEPAPGQPTLERRVTLVSEAYRAPARGVTHAASLWEVALVDASYELDPSYSIFTTENLTELTLPAGLLLPGRAYRWRVAHVGSNGRSEGFLPEKTFSTAPFAAELVPVDLSPILNRDVVIDPGDETNDAFDGDGKSFLVVDGFDGATTENEAVRGLPADRRVGVHRLASYGEANALQLAPRDEDAVRIEIPRRRYSALRLLLSGGNGDSRVPALLEYADGTFGNTVVPCDDWYHDPPPDSIGHLQAGLWPVRNGMDRVYEGKLAISENDPALFEHIVVMAPGKELVAIELRPADGFFSSENTRFNLFAITGVAESSD